MTFLSCDGFRLLPVARLPGDGFRLSSVTCPPGGRFSLCLVAWISVDILGPVTRPLCR